MTDLRVLLDPTGELIPAQRERQPRPSTLEGLTIGLLDIAKARGDVFLARLAERLTQRGLTVKQFKKPTFARIAPLDLRQAISTDCDVVIEGLAD